MTYMLENLSLLSHPGGHMLENWTDRCVDVDLEGL